MRNIPVFLWPLGFLGIFLTPVHLLAEDPGAAELARVKQALEEPFGGAEKERSIRDFRADFHQISKIASLDRIQEGKGDVAVRFESRSGKGRDIPMFRWNYEQPTPQEIISDGRTLWVYVPENRQAIRSELDADARLSGDDPLVFLTGLGNLEKDFQISWAGEPRNEKGDYRLELIPRRPSPYFQKLMLTVDQGAVAGPGKKKSPLRFPILSATLMDPAGNTTLIEFRNARVNQGLSDKLFRFTPPEGVEVLRPTEGGAGQ